MLPKKFDRVDIVADTYREKSIKCGEITKRGSSSKVIIGSCKSKVPRDFASFMKNGENKTRFIEIISEVIVDNRVKAIKLLQTEVIYISRYHETICITEPSAIQVQELSSNQEEAYTTVILHSLRALATGSSVILRSPSADTDIMVIAISLILADSKKLYIAYGSGQHRKGLLLSSVDLSSREK